MYLPSRHDLGIGESHALSVRSLIDTAFAYLVQHQYLDRLEATLTLQILSSSVPYRDTAHGLPE